MKTTCIFLCVFTNHAFPITQASMTQRRRQHDDLHAPGNNTGGINVAEMNSAGEQNGHLQTEITQPPDTQ